ncbi:hypothetical protein ACJJJB_00130 (plasmid) [Microbulbifer sp. ANSA001]|uniref:hypothetical protein n=1 Tax=Microbulbifer sp. ANSA001 TaxID=3243358 RepID=UPI004042BAE7
MDAEQILAAIKAGVNEYDLGFARRCGAVDEQKFCERNGVITSRIARGLGVSNSDARKALDKLVKRGVVLKSRENAGNFCRWWPVGFLEELRGGPVLAE